MAYNLGTAQGKIVVDGSGAAEGFKIASEGAEAMFDVIKARMGLLEQLSQRLIKIGVAGQIGMTGAVVAAANFEQRLSAIQAVSGATETQMKAVSAAALRIGADTAFTASDAANAMEELAKAGISLEDIINGAADATVNLAAAGGIEMATAAEIAANAINNFNLRGKDMAHIADMIAGAANASSISVADFGTSLTQAGAVAALSGLNIDDLSIAIAEMGKAGIKGSDAGTSIKTLLLNLQPVTDRQKALFEQLGLTTNGMANQFFDAQGKIRPMIEIQQVLADAVGGMTEQQKLQTLEILFGQDAIRSSAVLAKAGAAGYDQMAKSMSKVTAADVAKTRMDNLKGAIEQLKGSIESATIAIGTPFLGAIKGVTDAITAAVNLFNKLPEPVKNAIAVVIGLGTGLALLAGIFLHLLPALIMFLGKILAMRTVKGVFDIFKTGFTALKAGEGIWGALSAAMSKAETTAKKTGGSLRTVITALRNIKAAGMGAIVAMGLIAAAVIVATVIYTQWADAQEKAKANIEELTAAIEADSGALGDNTRATVADILAKNGLFDAAHKVGINLATLTNAALGDANAMNQVATAVDKARGSGMAWSDEQAQTIDAANKVAGGISGLNGEVNQAVQAAKDHTEAMAPQATGIKEVGNEAETTEAKIRGMVDAIFAATDAAAGATRADINFREAEDNLREALKKSKGSTSHKTAEGRAAARAALEYRDAAKEVVKAQYGLDDSGMKSSFAMQKLRETFIKAAVDGGILPKVARKMANDLGLIPDKVSTQFLMPGATTSKKQAKEIAAAVKTIPALATTTIVAKNARPSKQAVKDFAATIKGIPKEAKTAVVTAYKYGGLEGAKTALGNLKDKDITVNTIGKTKGAKDAKKAVDEVKSKDVTITVHYVQVGVKPPPRASGGPVKKNRVYQVGERGPELFMAPEDGRIVDAAKSRSMLKGLSNLGFDSANNGVSTDVLSALRAASNAFNAMAQKPNKESTMSVSSIPVAKTTIVNHKKYEFNTHNPVAEKSSESNLKAMVRTGALGVFA